MAGNKRSLDEMYGAPTPTDLFNVDSTQTVTYAILPITFNPDEPPVKRSKYEEKKNKYSALKEKYINLKASKAHADRRVEDYIKRLAEFEKHASSTEYKKNKLEETVSKLNHEVDLLKKKIADSNGLLKIYTDRKTATDDGYQRILEQYLEKTKEAERLAEEKHSLNNSYANLDTQFNRVLRENRKLQNDLAVLKALKEFENISPE